MLKKDLLLLFNNATQAARLMCRGISVQKRTDSLQEAGSRFLLSILCNYVVKRSNEPHARWRIESISRPIAESQPNQKWLLTIDNPTTFSTNASSFRFASNLQILSSTLNQRRRITRNTNYKNLQYLIVF